MDICRRRLPLYALHVRLDPIHWRMNVLNAHLEHFQLKVFTFAVNVPKAPCLMELRNHAKYAKQVNLQLTTENAYNATAEPIALKDLRNAHHVHPI